jgi:hypothetical protein
MGGKLPSTPLHKKTYCPAPQLQASASRAVTMFGFQGKLMVAFSSCMANVCHFFWSNSSVRSHVC